MEVKLLAFGIAKDILGGATADITLSNQPTVGDLRNELTNRYPELKKLRSFMIAVNNNYAQDELVLTTTDEIAIIPPVSGG